VGPFRVADTRSARTSVSIAREYFLKIQEQSIKNIIFYAM
jgi:hypothetical protein